MKRIYLLAMLVMFSYVSFSQVRNAYRKDDLEKVSMMIQETEAVDNLKNVASEPSMLRAGGELDYTVYDWQTNHGARTWTIQWPDGKVNFAYTHSSEDSPFSDRGTAIGTYDAVNDVWTPGGARIENERTGSGSIARYGENGIVLVSFNSAREVGVYIIPDKDNIQPGTLEPVYLDSDYSLGWPNVMTSGPNRDIIHILATAQGHTVNGVTDPLLYFRSQDGGQTWDKQDVMIDLLDSSHTKQLIMNCAHWMETTSNNRLAAVINDRWIDGKVIYSDDNGETWDEIVYYEHPGYDQFFNVPFYYPRWVSAQWDSNMKLHIAYEFNASGGEVGSTMGYSILGGVAYWSEVMPLNPAAHAVGSVGPAGEPFIMNSYYIEEDIRNSLWKYTDASHVMLPEYIGPIMPLDDNGNPEEDPYMTTEFNIEDLTLHGDYNCGICVMPVLCIDPETNYMIAVWSAMDENNVDSNGRFYFKLFARASEDGGTTWSKMVQLTTDPSHRNLEHVYAQAVIRDGKLIVAAQVDNETGSYAESSEDNVGDNNYYSGMVFDIAELFNFEPATYYTITATANPTAGGTISGAGSFKENTTATLTATTNTGYNFVNWTENGTVVSTDAVYSFTVTEDRTLVANFEETPVTYYTVTATANPTAGGTVSGAGDFEENATATLTATANSGYNFINWMEDGIEVSTDTVYSFTVTEDRILVANFELLSIDEKAANSVMSIYPSPASGTVNVTVASDSEIVIYNTIGQTLLTIKVTAGSNTIDISSLSMGLYFISDGISTQKLLVK